MLNKFLGLEAITITGNGKSLDGRLGRSLNMLITCFIKKYESKFIIIFNSILILNVYLA